MLTNGYFKLYRKIYLKLRGRADLLHIYLELMNSAYVSNFQYVFPNKKTLEVTRGQILTSLRCIALELGISRNNLKYSLQELGKMGLVVASRHQNYTLFSLPLYDFDEDNLEVVAHVESIGCSQAEQLYKGKKVPVAPKLTHSCSQPEQLVAPNRSNCGSQTEQLWVNLGATKEEDRRTSEEGIKILKEGTSHISKITALVSALKNNEDLESLTTETLSEGSRKPMPETRQPLEVGKPEEDLIIEVLLEETFQETQSLTIEPPRTKATRPKKTKTPQNGLEAPSMEVMDLAKAWVSHAQAIAPWHAFKDLDFAHGILKAMTTAQLDIQGMRGVFHFVRGDDFWLKNAISPIGLTKKKDGKEFSKLDYILLAMRKSRHIKDAQAIHNAKKMDEKLKELGRTKPLTHHEAVELELQRYKLMKKNESNPG